LKTWGVTAATSNEGSDRGQRRRAKWGGGARCLLTDTRMRSPPVLRGEGYSTVLGLPPTSGCAAAAMASFASRTPPPPFLLSRGERPPPSREGSRAKGARRPRCARRVPRREGPHQGPPRARSRYARATAAGHAGELRAGGCERRHRRGGVRRVTTMGGSRLVLYIGSVLQQCSCCNCLLFMLQSLLRMLSFDVANM
jgi:hypothetical protein